MEGQKSTKRPTFDSILRRKLSDITNSQRQQQQQQQAAKVDEKLSQILPEEVEDYVKQLQKENMKLARLIEERNKLIELSAGEIKYMRICLQKYQLQNWNLVQENTHLVAEIGSAKDKLKVLQHETLSKNALLKTKNSELKKKRQIEREKPEFLTSVIEEEAIGEGLKNTERSHKPNRKRSAARSQSMGASSTQRQGEVEDKAENKRHCTRRQSAIFRSEGTCNLFEIEETKHMTGLTSGRHSMGRPSRRAAEKVQSYKEVPLNVKMRRDQ